jgi:hypothetical protein
MIVAAGPKYYKCRRKTPHLRYSLSRPALLASVDHGDPLGFAPRSNQELEAIMMKLYIMATLILADLGLTVSSEAEEAGMKVISESEVRAVSAALYSDILVRACRHGWRYPRAQIENGFKRHFEELKLQLVHQGYTILTQGDVPSSHVQSTIVETKHHFVGAHQFSCARPYWLDE